MNTDIRLSVGFWRHPKTVKLQRRLGLEAVRSLQILWLWAAENRPSGDLSGMDEEDLAIAADWLGETEKLVGALSSIGFLDGECGSYSLHGWQENNAWASGEPTRADKGRFARLKGIEALKDSAQALEAAGVTRISKADYAALVDEGTRKVTLERLLGQSQGQPSEVPQGDLKQTSEDTLRQPLTPTPTPTPTPAPTPEPTPNVLEEHTHDGSHDLIAPDRRGVCVYSQEDVEEAKQDVRREAAVIRQEFDRLRDAYKAVRDDGPNAGWAEYQQARFAKGWPGLLIVLDRLQTLIEQDEQWRRGYKEGLRRFLADRMWEMEPRKAAPQQPAAPAAQRGRPQAGMTWADVRTEKNKQACQNGLKRYLEEQGIAMEEELEKQPYVEWTATVEE